MTQHISYDHQCPKCEAFYIPYDDQIPCPKCGVIESERIDYIEQAVCSMRSNCVWGGRYTPGAWLVQSLGDHILNLLFPLFDAYVDEESGEFRAFAANFLGQYNWGSQRYLEEHVLGIAIRLHKTLKHHINERKEERDEDRLHDVLSELGFIDDEDISEEHRYFRSFQEARIWATNNPGKAFTASPNRIGYVLRDVVVESDARGAGQSRLRIGDYDLREPDYRLIVDWAEELNKKPEEFLHQLAKMEIQQPEHFQTIGFEVGDGAITSIVWDCSNLGHVKDSGWKWVFKGGGECEPVYFPGAYEIPSVAPNDYQKDLIIHTLAIKGLVKRYDTDRGIRPILPGLKTFVARNCALLRLDLSQVPKLTALICEKSGLRELDLSQVPLLTELSCENNIIRELDLSSVPNLKKLHCSAQGYPDDVFELDLSPVPLLTELSCAHNEREALDLSPVPMLTKLNCQRSNLNKLDLSPAPMLTELNCQDNNLKKLDLSPVPMLAELDCSGNQIKELDLSPAPMLTALNCLFTELKELDLSPVSELEYLLCDRKNVKVINEPAGVKWGAKWYAEKVRMDSPIWRP